MKRFFSRLAVLVALLIAALVPANVGAQSASEADRLLNAVNTTDVLRSLRQFQEAAERNNDTRAAGTRGYDRSADYIAKLLQRRGYSVTRQTFEIAFWEETAPATFERVSPAPRTYTPDEFGVKQFAGSGDVAANITAISTLR